MQGYWDTYHYPCGSIVYNFQKYRTKQGVSQKYLNETFTVFQVSSLTKNREVCSFHQLHINCERQSKK